MYPSPKVPHFPNLHICISYGNAERKNAWSLPSSRDSVLLFVLSSGKVAGKVVPVSAPVATNVTLEGVFVAMATHVNGVEDIVWKIDVAVGAVLEQLRLVGRVRRSRLAVSAAVSGRARPVTALPPMGRVPNVWRRCECHNGTGNVAGNGGRWLYKERGLFLRKGVRAG